MFDTESAKSPHSSSLPQSVQDTPSHGRPRKKILFAINKLSIGGAERLLLHQLQGIDTSRFETHLVTLLPSPSVNFDDAVTHLGSAWKKFSFTSPFDIWGWFQLYRYLRREKFDAVVTSLFLAGYMVRSAAYVAGVPIIIASEVNVYEKRSLFMVCVERLLAPITYRILANSTEVLERARVQLGLPREKFLLNYSTVDLRAIHPASSEEKTRIRTRYAVPANTCVLVTAGRLVEQKGHRDLIEAVSLLRAQGADIRLYLFGDGALRSALEEQVSTLQLSSIVFLPGTAPIVDILALGDIFILPSLWEGLSLVLLEAMAGGLPIVATDVSGSREVVVHGVTGLITPPKDPVRLAEHIATLVRDPARRAAFGTAAVNEAKQYAIQNHLEKLYSVLEGEEATRSS